MKTFLERALPLAERGLPVMPLQPAGKEAIVGGWPSKATTDRAQLEKWAQHVPDANVGVVGRRGGYWILDIDRGDLKGEIEAATGHTLDNLTFTVKTAHGYHLYFVHERASEEMGNLTVRDEAGAELFSTRSLDRYVVGPGSIHPSGAVYEVINPAVITQAPMWLLDWLKGHSNGNGHRTRAASERPSTQVVGTGGRNVSLTRLAGSMRRYGATESAIFAALVEQNARACVPPLSEREVGIIAHSVARYAPEDTLGVELPTLEVLPVRAFMARETEVAPAFMGPILRQKHIMEVYAPRGVGKTFFCVGLGLALAAGDSFIKWRADRARRVLYLDGEMAEDEFKDRLRGLLNGVHDHARDNFYVMNLDRFDGGTPNITRPEGRAMLGGAIEAAQAEVIFLDNLSVFAPVDENESGEWTPVQEWLLSLRRAGITTVFVHHAGKSGRQRGTSRREDICNTVIQLSHPHNYEEEEGMRCVMRFEKHRGFYGNDAEPLELSLVEQGNGLVWTYTRNRDLEVQMIREMRAARMSQRQIAEQLGISQTTVYRILRESRMNRPDSSDSEVEEIEAE